MRPSLPSGTKERIRVESGSASRKLIERHDWTISLAANAESIVPLIWPLKARNEEPASALTVTGAPVTAAWSDGSRYVAYNCSADAGRTTDCVIKLRMNAPLSQGKLCGCATKRLRA